MMSIKHNGHTSGSIMISRDQKINILSLNRSESWLWYFYDLKVQNVKLNNNANLNISNDLEL